MKNYLQFSLRALFLSLAVLLSLPMLAEKVVINWINYELDAETKQATVIRKSSGKYSGEIVIPESVEYEGIAYSVTSIGERAFYDCSGLTSVTIPNSVTSIWPWAFAHCSGLTSVTIPNSVTSIGERAFYWCSGLTSVTIPNSVTSIGNHTFYYCSGLTSVTIPNSVTSIGGEAFYGCSGLTSVHISDIAAWCNIDFGSNPLYYAHHLYLNGEEVKDLVIPNSVTSIGDLAFNGCSGLTSVTIPNSVTSIGAGAFYYCSGLTSVTIPNSVTSIGNYTFYYCSGLTSVTIPNSVKRIGEYAFSGCSGLTSVHISDIAAWCNIYFGFSESNPLYYAHHLYLNGEEVKDLVIPNSVTSIGYQAFSGCSGLTSVTIPNSVTSIGNYAFGGCSGLTSVTIPNSVTSIGYGAFNDCSGLTSVTIGNSVTSIGNTAFKGCMLQTIVCKAIQPIEIGNELYSTNMYNHTQLYVPEGAYWDYAFSGWGSFIRIKEMAMDTEDLESRNAYMIADASGRNYSVYDSTKGNLVNVAYTHALDEESEGSCWTVLKDGATSYLYNIGAKKYGIIADDGMLTLSDSPVGVDIVSTEEGLSINGKPCMFVLNNNIKFDATGIENLDATTENAATYDLSGRRVQNAQKGIYIKNGKKVMVK